MTVPDFRHRLLRSFACRRDAIFQAGICVQHPLQFYPDIDEPCSDHPPSQPQKPRTGLPARAQSARNILAFGFPR